MKEEQQSVSLLEPTATIAQALEESTERRIVELIESRVVRPYRGLRGSASENQTPTRFSNSELASGINQRKKSPFSAPS